MRVYLVDEGKYPSGFAGGRFSAERPDLRMQGLGICERIAVGPGETLSRQLPPEVVGAIVVNQVDQSSQTLDTRSGTLRWTAPADKMTSADEATSEGETAPEGQWEVWLVDHAYRTSVTRAASNPTRGKDAANALCDYLNPAATRQFIAFTHEEYEQAFGAEFGRTVLGFRGDEPDFAHVPWTPDLPAEFERRKGYDVRPYLASTFAPLPGDEARRARADYWDVWSDLFAEHFIRIQAEWCAARGLAYLVHLNHEDNMPALIRSEGSFFRAMRHVPVPGIDAIWNQIWPDRVADYPKLASSAAHLAGRPRAFSESFAAYRVRPTVDQAKWVIDHQFVRGINLLEVMFYPSSAAGHERSGWLASDRFPALAAYVQRAAYLLSMGRPAAQIALYYPTDSLWLGDEEADASAWAIAQALLERQRDFDFVDERALSSFLALEDGVLRNASGQGYRTVILPSLSVLSRGALDRLRAFAGSGEHVVLLGRAPSLVVDRTFLHAVGPPDVSWSLHEATGALTDRVLDALPHPDVTLDRPCPAVKALHRRWSQIPARGQDADLYFFFNESDQAQSCQATLVGRGSAQVWDAASGQIEALPDAVARDAAVRVPLNLAPYESRFVVIGPR